jgi:hypothetical protein
LCIIAPVPADEDSTTSRFKLVDVVLVVGQTSEFVDRCRDVAPSFGAVVQACDLATAPTMCARLRPLVVLLSEDVYAFDPSEFDALARDTSSRILRLADDEIPLEALELLVGAAVHEAQAQRAAALAL